MAVTSLRGHNEFTSEFIPLRNITTITDTVKLFTNHWGDVSGFSPTVPSGEQVPARPYLGMLVWSQPDDC